MDGMKDALILPRRRRSNAAERDHWVQRFAQSGLCRREFAGQHGLRLSTLQRWLGKAKAKAPVFAEVKLPGLTTRWAAEVVEPGGRVLRLAHDVPTALLKEL